MPLPRSEGRGPAEAVALKFSPDSFRRDLREKDLKPIVLDVIDQAYPGPETPLRWSRRSGRFEAFSFPKRTIFSVSCGGANEVVTGSRMTWRAASSSAPLKAPATHTLAINTIYGTETTKRWLWVPVVRLRSIRLRIELFLILSAVMFRDLLPRLIDVVEGRFWFRFTRQYCRQADVELVPILHGPGNS
jgi:hypothetical protein